MGYHVRWATRGGSREVGHHTRWVTRGGLREVYFIMSSANLTLFFLWGNVGGFVLFFRLNNGRRFLSLKLSGSLKR